MKRLITLLAVTLLCAFNSRVSTVSAQGTAFTYQGRLNSSGSLANGSYDLTFTLYVTNINGSVAAGPVTNSATAVTNGLFTTLVDFGAGVFTGTSNWLEIAVRTNGAGNFSPLAPRQQVTPTPYAIFANTASNLSGMVSAAQINSVIPNSLLPNFQASANYASIGGGIQNTSSASYAVVGGGNVNTASGTDSTVAGGYNNTAGNFSTVGGGYQNNARGVTFGDATVSGGTGNNATNDFSTVGGGQYNLAGGPYATVPGGSANRALGKYSLATGQQAQATNQGAFVWADSQNAPFTSTNNDSFNVRAAGGLRLVTGGAGMVVDGQPVFAGLNGGSLTNLNAAQLSGSIPGGVGVPAANLTGALPAISGASLTNLNASQLSAGTIPNSVLSGFQGNDNTIGGGYQNISTGGFDATVAGGYQNQALNSGAAVGGGGNNIASGLNSTTAGGSSNQATNTGSTIGGGYNNLAGGQYATIAGGQNNAITGGSIWGTISGGQNNSITGGNQTAVGGGIGNVAGATYATVAGGQQNTNTSQAGSIAGGQFNVASGQYQSAVGGGYNNTAGASYATIPGGFQNVASGANSLAAGSYAHAANPGSFVWADNSSATPFASTANNQFAVRAQGGVSFATAGAGVTVDGQPMARSYGTPISSAPFTISQPGAYYLTTNLTVTTGDAIDISVNGVTLDLNGFTITSSASSATGTAINLSNTKPNSDITIVNGHIVGGVTNNSGSYAGPGFQHGITFLTPNPLNILVSGVSVSGCLGNGIYLKASLDTSSTVVEHSVVNTVGGVGISGGSVSHCCANSCGGSGIEATTASDCQAISSGAGNGILALTAHNCVGISAGGIGLYSVNSASDCDGTSTSNWGSFVNGVANNCYGLTSTGGYGLYVAKVANNCFGINSGSGTGLYVGGTATGCEGSASATGTAISAYIAIGCINASGTNNITYKYNMP